jgi:hypothetical protein
MRYLKVKLIIALVLISTIGITLTFQSGVSAQRERGPSVNEQKLLDAAARQLGAGADRLQMLNITTVDLPLTGRRVQVAKVRSANDGRVVSASIDEQGQEVEFSALKANEHSAYRARYGKLDPKLHRKVEGARSDQNLKLAFWVNPAEDLDAQDPRNGRTDLTAEEVEELLARRAQQVKMASSRATEGLARALQRAGHNVERRAEGAPIVFASLPAGLVKQFSERSDVQLVYLTEDNNYQDHMNVAGPSIKADSLWSAGITGAGSRIAIVEDSRVDFDNSCLPNNLGTRVPDHPEVDDHATATAGMAASTSSRFSGIAPGAGIYSSNATTYIHEHLISAALDAGAANAHVLNNSWGLGCGSQGVVDVHARHADYIVRYLWDTVTASAGNSGQCTNNEYVTTIGTGYNVITVGNYDDSGTVKSTDNVMNPTSSFKDPISSHGDREKPEVAAPGTNIRSTIMTTPGDCATADVGSGTSYSAPIVAGLAAGLMHAQPSLRVFPESVKALIMAGAIDNVEGARGLSEYDGAGGVNALASYNSTINNRHLWRSVVAGDFDANRDININLGWVNAGQRVKVALVWDSNPTADYTIDPLNADLDLYVTGPNDYHPSASFDNSYETVDFTATTSGNFQITVKNFRFNGFNEYIAVAWNL